MNVCVMDAVSRCRLIHENSHQLHSENVNIVEVNSETVKSNTSRHIKLRSTNEIRVIKYHVQHIVVN